MCIASKIVLKEYSKGIFKRKIRRFDHSSITGSGIITRQHTWTVCEISSSSGLRQYNSKLKVGRPSTLDLKQDEPSPVKLCSFCLSEIAPGKSHMCTKTMRESNRVNSIIVTQEKSADKIVSAVFKIKMRTK